MPADDNEIVDNWILGLDRAIERHKPDQSLEKSIRRIGRPKRVWPRLILLAHVIVQVGALRFDRDRRTALRQLDRLLAGRSETNLMGDVRPCGPTETPTIAQVAAELRRLENQRRRGTRGSAAWFAAVTTAYDEWLRVACRALALDENLAQLDGIDRDLERLRVEAELAQVGLRLGRPG